VALRVVLGGGDAHTPRRSVATSIKVTPVTINLVCLDQGMSHVRSRPIGKQTTRLAATPIVSHCLRLPRARTGWG
jgi:hypothetical protein